jgi:regulator of sigma E protease
MKIFYAILVFSIIILIHELGHFLIAKKNGIKVIEFSLGMGPRIISFMRKDTRYSLKLFPIGGSCMMLGEDGSDLVHEEGSFASKNVWSRFSTIFAGPLFNFIYAFILSIIIISMNGYDVPVISSLDDNGVAYKAGIREGDMIIKYNGDNIRFYRDLSFTDYMEPMINTDKINVSVSRNGEILHYKLNPEKDTRYLIGFNYVGDSNPIKVTSVIENSPLENSGIEVGDIITSINNVEVVSSKDLINYLKKHPLSDEDITLTFSHKSKSKTITVKPTIFELYDYGFAYSADLIQVKGINIIKYSYYETSYWIKTGLKSLGYLIRGKVGVDQMSGPVGIVNNIGKNVDETSAYGAKALISTLITWSILLSSNLGIMNLLPLPALDGGRLVFILIEALRGKPINREKEGYIHLIGFMLLMLLMIFVFINDIKAIM